MRTTNPAPACPRRRDPEACQKEHATTATRPQAHQGTDVQHEEGQDGRDYRQHAHNEPCDHPMHHSTPPDYLMPHATQGQHPQQASRTPGDW